MSGTGTSPGPGSGQRIAAWVDRPDISARSVLVTLLGDSIAPLGGSLWLGDLFELAARFGYNDRLVRTTMFRLASEGWVASERVGRRSRYSLTEFAAEEFLNADRRIYRPAMPDDNWSGRWVTVLTQAGTIDPADRERIVDHLRWRGFAEIGRGVWALPSAEVAADAAEVTQLFKRLALPVDPPVAVAEFTNLDTLVTAGVVADSFDLETTEANYRRLLDNHRWLTTAAADELAAADALALRTMLVHDLRRARLNDPDLPSAILPARWIGREATEMAGEAYRRISPAAWTEIERVTDLRLDQADDRLRRRFR